MEQALILAGGLGTRFLPLSQMVPKQFLPLASRPTFQYLVEEAINSGAKEITFVTAPGGKKIHTFYKPSSKLKKILKQRDEKSLLEKLDQVQNLTQEISFTSITQKKPLGNGQAVFLARKAIGDNPFAVLFIDDVIDSKPPAVAQLEQTFKTAHKPVVALKRVSSEQIPNYGIAKVEKISRGLYKIKDIIEKPSPEQAPSELAVVGRFILTPEVIDYLRDAPFNKNQEKTIATGLDLMRKDGKVVYGTEIKGKWLDCGDPFRYLKSNLYHMLNHPQYGEELKKYLKEI